MAQARLGSIPADVTLIGRIPCEVTLPEALASEPGEKLSLVEVYISDATNAKTLESGRRWAAGWSHRATKTDKPYELTRPNAPMEGVRILTLEKRGNGGRAYKVVLPEGNYYVDLREDVLVDAMLGAGISAGGLLNGSFVFARVASEMKLVRVGSKLHDRLVADTAVRNTPIVSLSDLIPGHAYETKGGLICVYLGVADCDEVHTQIGNGLSHYSYHDSGPHPLYAATVPVRGKQCWFDFDGGTGRCVRDWDDKRNVSSAVTATFVAKKPDFVKLVSDRQVIKDLGRTKLCDFILTPLDQIREAAAKLLTKHLADPSLVTDVKYLRQRLEQSATYANNAYSSRAKNPIPVRKSLDPDIERALVCYVSSAMCTIRPTNDTVTPVWSLNPETVGVKEPVQLTTSDLVKRYRRGLTFEKVTGAMQVFPDVYK